MDVSEMITKAGLAKRTETIKKLIRPSIRIISQVCDDHALELGSSKFGGTPDLPPNYAWPYCGDKPLSFIAQFKLSELIGLDREQLLPQEGMLYFFYNSEEQVWGYDPADRGNWRVTYSNVPAEQLVATLPPPELDENLFYRTGRLKFRIEDTIPGTDALILKDAGLTFCQSMKYSDFYELYYESDEDKVNRLLGYPQEIQNEMQEECQFASHGIYCSGRFNPRDPLRKALKPGARNWQLLLQVDSEEDLGMCWGDAGRLYFWIPRDALTIRDFTQVWLILQCY